MKIILNIIYISRTKELNRSNFSDLNSSVRKKVLRKLLMNCMYLLAYLGSILVVLYKGCTGT